ncbi:MAG: CoA-binding protein, partial [Thermodesulfobacteriota bacterium]|nr:CoA-binding protein [Thermodesulfobacteriota bacterium]
EEGNVAFIAQSGGLAMKFSQFGTMYGINFSKVVSFGNGADIDFTDFLHYLAHDPHTDIITAYLEGIRDGSKFLEIVRDPTFRKPFIIWKAGKTKTGARAAASHTGSMAGDNTMWEAIFKQNGIVGVDSFEELLETLLLFRLAPESGPKVAIVTGGGGAGVSATDLCANVGLDVPELSPKTCKRLREFVPHSGTSVKNPVDMAANAMNVDANIKVIEIVAEDENVDTLMVLGTPEAVRAKDFTEGLIQNKNNFKKPVLPVMPIISGEMIDIHKTLSKHFPVFLSEESTARALANLITYQKKKILFPKNETK